MRYLRLSVLLVLTGVCILHAGEGGTPTDLDRMQGVWRVVSLVEKGKEVPAKELEELEIVILKDAFSVSEKGKVAVEYRIKLDASKSPRAIDFTHQIGEDKGKTEPGIYAIEKEQLKFVMNEDRKGRPTVFEGKETTAYSVIVLKKKEAKK